MTYVNPNPVKECLCGVECRDPCWQRLGLTEACQECGCPPLPTEAEACDRCGDAGSVVVSVGPRDRLSGMWDTVEIDCPRCTLDGAA